MSEPCNRSFRNTRRKKEKGKPFQGRQTYDQLVSADLEEDDVIIHGEEINVSTTTTDIICTSTNVTLGPVVDNDSSPNTDGIETVSQKKVKEIDFPAEEN